MTQLVRRWNLGPARSIELHLTPDIVALPPGSSCYALVNSANERLQSTQFNTSEAAAAFPGTQMIYPEQVVDGRVLELGGRELQLQLSTFPPDAAGTRCPTGDAVITALSPSSMANRASPLSQNYKEIVHAVAPLYGSPDWAFLLGRCYHQALGLVYEAAAHHHPVISVASPLLGAGAKGTPVELAARIAAQHCASWQHADSARCMSDNSGRSSSSSKGANAAAAAAARIQSAVTPPTVLDVRFGVQEDEVAGVVEDACDEVLNGLCD